MRPEIGVHTLRPAAASDLTSAQRRGSLVPTRELPGVVPTREALSYFP
jgi:hypothetical protein